MNYRKSHFAFNKSQRNGIFLLVIIILILFYGMYYVNNSSSFNIFSTNEDSLVSFQHYIDSLKLKKKEKETYKIYPFNPNFITDYKGYVLGMTPAEIDRLHEFREKDKWINSKADFKKVTGVSDSLLNEISPYFKFPDWVIEKRKREKTKTAEKTELSFREKKDLNSATKKELQKINGIGEAYSTRIIRYRTKIGGFVDDIQLKDIYGLDYKTEQKVLEKFTVKNPPEIQKIDINKATLIQLSEIIYFNYELAREIIDYRILNEGIDTFEELAKIDDFPSHKIDRIKLYLQIK
ncbi:ComEA family DNA-binding protein [Mesonia maritima]|uniref:DNA uptake protein ComE-like DNA-binding protein n=1 Tax=Mesonia maritima TaxID=1793873 RepID=A0ABU1K6E8_9FLAO|nr:helix-hairpin-helix domain-containing protein [Mesonia maritima]MDR6301184.1 DNA uptake protein ComE-like DNA-binding protein [Mesonia maritima]